jgi:signal recognition particle subunit SEC65
MAQVRTFIDAYGQAVEADAIKDLRRVVEDLGTKIKHHAMFENPQRTYPLAQR